MTAMSTSRTVRIAWILGAFSFMLVAAVLVHRVSGSSPSRLAMLFKGHDLSLSFPARISDALPKIWNGPQIQIVLIGSAGCGASRQPTFVSAFRQVRTRFERLRAQPGMHVSFVGVALDPIIEDGLSFLRELGPFDQISIGEDWLNDEAVRFLWRDLPGAGGIPQVLVVKRSLMKGSTWYRFGRDDVLLRKVGIEALSAWASKGAPVDGL